MPLSNSLRYLVDSDIFSSNIALQADGKLLLAIETNPSLAIPLGMRDRSYRLLRLNTDATPDINFGVSGVVTGTVLSGTYRSAISIH